jgi:hypothetical protein
VKCKNGKAVVEPGNAKQTFRCNNVCLLFVIADDMRANLGEDGLV